MKMIFNVNIMKFSILICRKYNYSKYFFFREDFTKVFDVVREQIEKALLTKNNGGPKTFEEFKNRVSRFSLL